MSKNFSKIVRKYIIHYQTSQMISNETETLYWGK